MSDFSLRSFDPTSAADYAALADIMRAANPDYAKTFEELQERDRLLPEFGTKWNRWFACDSSGKPMGSGAYVPALWMPEAGKYFLELQVLPEWIGKGVGKALFAEIWESLEKQNPTYVKKEWREDQTRAVRFFADRGFREVSRYYESRLDIAGFDFAPFADDFDRPLAHGVTIISWRELKETYPDANRKMWEAAMDISRDVPRDKPFEPISQEAFESLIMNRPRLDPDGYFVAVDRETGEYVGISHIWRRMADNDLDTGLTGVRQVYRRRGIALALKLRVLRWAQANGFRMLRTGNEVNNRPMLAINERLGFEKIPPWIEMVWKPKWEDATA